MKEENIRETSSNERGKYMRDVRESSLSREAYGNWTKQ